MAMQRRPRGQGRPALRGRPLRADASRRRAVVVLVAAVLAVLLSGRLGFWQMDRAAQKTALQQAIDARAAQPPVAPRDLARDAPQAEEQHWRRVALAGRWLPERSVYLDNRQMDGRPGFFVLTPLVIGPQDAVLVQRGWVPRNAQDRGVLPPIETPDATTVVEVVGRIAPPPARLYEFDHEEGGAIRQNLALDAYAREIGLPLRPVTVQQTEGPADGLTRHWPPPAVDVARHYGYAFQWFALCALISGLYVWFQLVRPRLSRAAR